MNTNPSTSAEETQNTNQITVVNRQLSIQPFLVSHDTNDTAVRWSKWKKNIERQFRFFGIIDPTLKKDGMIIYGGQHIADIEDSLPDIPQQEGDDAYSTFIRKLDRHFLPKKNRDYARFQLGNLTQVADESMGKYYARIREVAQTCEFANEEDAIRDHLIKTMINNGIRSKTIRHNWALAKILEEAAIEEETQEQAGEIDQKVKAATANIQRVQDVGTTKRKQTYVQQQKECGRCGLKHNPGYCRAKGAECRKCGKRNHYARVCRSSKSNDGPKTGKKNAWQNNKDGGHTQRDQRVRHVENQPDRDQDQDSDSTDEDIQSIAHHMSIHHISQTTKPGENKCTIKINGTEVEMEPDTGADTNVMDEYQFHTLLKNNPGIELKKSKVKLKTLKEDLPVLGECSVLMENETRITADKLIIIRGRIDSKPLLGRRTLEDLGMVKFDTTGGLKEPNREDSKAIHKTQAGNVELDGILQKHSQRFKGIGKAQREGKVIEIHLPLKDDADPITQKPRRVPYHLLEPLQQCMEEFVEKEIMEKVPDHEPITWCSPLVVQPKPRNPNDIRVSLDLRVLNKSMERTRNVQAPITEDFITTFKDCQIFSKLDMNHGYHQFCLDEESRKLMTFASPWGNYRYKRLAFGGVNSQDLFDSEMSRILSGIPRTLNNRDDILVGGINMEDHNKNLNTLLERLEMHNLTLRKEKCEFGKSKIEFHGHLFTSEGLKPSPAKIQAVQNCTPPRSKEELVSFIQMMAYLSRYISNFSSRTEPLRRLTTKDAKFIWKEEQKRAFQDLKTAITTAPVLIPYKPGRDTLVVCDGSPTGLGGALLQKTNHGYQPVHYVSRSLTDTEKRYSQIEREALAAEFTTTRLHMYLLGAPHFQLATDHKPLLPLMNNPKSKLPPRLERIIMKMQNLDYTAIHIPGKSNMTDYISRHPLPATDQTSHDKHVKAAIEADHAVVMETVRQATQDDKELQKLKKALETGKWDKADPDIAPYYDLKIFMAEGILLRHDKIIPPEGLRDKIIRVAHKQGHLGISKTKECIRRKYWFPIMNKRIEDIVSTCFSCQVTTSTQHTEPAKMTTLPERPWETIEADFCGPFPNNLHVLVVTDQYSRYPEAEFLTSTAIKPVRKKFKKIFATHGVPDTLQTDNGPPFNSEEFQNFAQESGFHHKKITPRHPKAQGQVEGFNKLINKVATIATMENIDVQEAIIDLLVAYRDTPHPATKETPYNLLMNREVKTKLERFPTEASPKDEQVRGNDKRYKDQAKQYHDKRHRAEKHKMKVGNAVIVRRETKRKAETTYEPHIYIVTQIKGSTIFARRLSDGKGTCRDSSKFKLLKRAQEERNANEDTSTKKSAVPPAYDGQQVQQVERETSQQATTAASQEPGVRRSARNRTSVFQGHLKDFQKP